MGSSAQPVDQAPEGRVILAATGHEPDRITARGVTAADPAVFAGLVDFATSCLEREAPEMVLTDMREGWGWAVAQACADSGLRFISIVNHGQRFKSPKLQRHYHWLINQGSQIGMPPEDWERCHGSRWKFMVRHADKLMTLWNGGAGTTADAVARAYNIDLPVVNVWKEWVAFVGGE